MNFARNGSHQCTLTLGTYGFSLLPRGTRNVKATLSGVMSIIIKNILKLPLKLCAQRSAWAPQFLSKRKKIFTDLYIYIYVIRL